MTIFGSFHLVKALIVVFEHWEFVRIPRFEKCVMMHHRYVAAGIDKGSSKRLKASERASDRLSDRSSNGGSDPVFAPANGRGTGGHFAQRNGAVKVTTLRLSAHDQALKYMHVLSLVL